MEEEEASSSSPTAAEPAAATQQADATATATAAAHERTSQLTQQAVLQDLERQYMAVLQDRDRLQTALQTAQSKLAASDEQQQSSADAQRERQQLQNDLQTKTQQIAALEEEKKLGQERVDRTLVEADRLREEISRLTKSNTEQTKTVADMQVQSKLQESQAIPLFHEKQRLQTELDSLQAHAAWLDQELSAKSRDYQHLQQESRDKSLQLQLQLDQTVAEKDAAAARLAVLEQIEQELQEKVQVLSKDHLTAKQELHAVQETSAAAVQEEQRLVKLQEQQLERWKDRYKDAVRENDSLKAAAATAMQASERELDEQRSKLETKYQQLLQEQAAEYKAKLQQQEQQQQQQGPALLAATAAPAAIAGGVAAAAGAADDDHDAEEAPLNMTDLYTRYQQTKLALRQETLLRQNWQKQFQLVQQEIADTKPKMLRQVREYEAALDQVTDYQQRLEQAAVERDDARQDVREAQHEVVTLRQVVATRKMECEELAKQVQALLVSRAGGAAGTGSDDAASIPTSVQEMQRQNQRLLVEQRRLNETIQQLQTQLDADELRNQLESAQQEVATLQKNRTEQEGLVQQIVLQRDLYKSLLASQESSKSSGGGGSGSLLDSPQEEASALDLVKQHAERSRQLQDKNKNLEGDLAAVRSELDRVARDKEGLSERLARHETHAAELTTAVDTLERNLLRAKSETARAAAESSYHQDKAERLEASLTRARDESQLVTTTKMEVQKICTELQQKLARAQEDVSRAAAEKRQVEGNLRLIQTQLETSKAAETRVSAECHQLRSELARQGAVVDSVRRIEASLTARQEREQADLQTEVDRLTKSLSAEQTKHASQMENWTARREEYDARIQDLTGGKDQAVQNASKFEKSLADAQSQVQTLTSKCSLLESQLRTAKKKLGEDDEEGDGGDGDEEAKMDDLSSQLDAAKAELASLQERAETYQKLSKDSETELASLKTAVQEQQSEREKELETLQRQLESAKQQGETKQQVIQELTDDLAGERGEREKLQANLQAQILSLQTQLENNKKDTEASKEAAVLLKLDVEALRNDATLAQNNYERELALHSQARSSLRQAREQAEEETRLRTAAEESKTTTQRQLDEARGLWQEEKATLQQSQQVVEKRLEEAKEQNTVLHTQLESLGTLVEKSQASRTTAAAASAGGAGEGGGDEQEDLQRVVSEHREIVRFLRSENEMIQTQLDTAKRTAERDRAAANVVKRSLDEARAELKVLRSSADDQAAAGTSAAAAAKDTVESKLRVSEEQVKLLSDSNHLLRGEVEKLQTQTTTLRADLEKSTSAAQPAEKVKQELGVKIASLEAEKDSLKRDLDSWKARVKSLVSKFNQIDPEEHKQLQKKVEEMAKEKESLNAWKKATEEENTRIRGIAKTLKNKGIEQKSQIEKQQSEIEKLAAERTKLLAASSSADSAAAKELAALKLKVGKMENDFNNAKTELQGTNLRNERLRERLRQFQNTIKELQKENRELKAAAAAAAAAGPKTAAAGPKAVVDLTGSASQGESGKVAENKEGVATSKTPMPTVPALGFKYGPSEKPDKTSTARSVDSSVPPAKAAAALRVEAATFKPKKPPTETGKSPPATAAAKAEPIATKPVKSSGPLKRKAAPDSEAEKPGVGKDAAGATTTASRPRRSSGTTKELEMKEILLEKKQRRQLMKLAEAKAKELAEIRERKRKAEEEAKKAQSEDEPSPKRSKMEGSKATVLDTGASTSEAVDKGGVRVEKATEGTTKPSEGTTPPPEEHGAKAAQKSSEESSQEEAVAEKPSAKTEAESKVGSTMETAETSGESTDGKAKTDTLVGGSATETKKKSDDQEVKLTSPPFTNPFSVRPAGGAPTMFGQSSTLSSNAPTSFGAVSAAPGSSGLGGFASLSQAPAPGGGGDQSSKPTTSAKPPGQGGPAPSSDKKASGASASNYGSAFLNMKPPGTSTSPPTFSFSTSSSIKLPTPSQPVAAAPSPFGAFGAGASFGGAFGSNANTPLSTRPLFGSPAAGAAEEEGKPEAKEQQADADDGKMDEA